MKSSRRFVPGLAVGVLCQFTSDESITDPVANRLYRNGPVVEVDRSSLWCKAWKAKDGDRLAKGCGNRIGRDCRASL